MNVPRPNIVEDRRPIRLLDAAAANRIAAGEVVERPASAVKELVENALDADARRVEVAYADGGRRLIRVQDDGCGIPADELALALERHATSKLDGGDLTRILSFGFRGEALPSLGAVGRLTLTSRAAASPAAATVAVRAGVLAPPRPAALGRGTVVELEGLFSATPARLKFLRSDRAEAQAIADVVRRLAMAAPGVGFTLTDRSDPEAPRELLRLAPEPGGLFDALGGRLRALLGAEFLGNALPVEAEREGVGLRGFAALPTFSRGAAVAQFLFVNGRPVRDKLLIGALARRLCRPARPRPASGGGAVPRLRPRGRRRQRPSGEGGGALPRSRNRARPRARGAAPDAGRRRAPRFDDDRRRHARELPAVGRGGARLARALGAGAAARLRRAGPPRGALVGESRARAGAGARKGARCRLASPARSCTRPTSSRRPPTAW